MFADRAKIFVRSGKGGDGHVSFRRELYVPNGGPDGGDGGDGGNVVFVVDQGLNTLTDFRNIRKYKAEDGEEGRKRNCHGANGKDVVLKVPPGTVIRDFDTGKVILDMADRTEPVVLFKGGRGGKGNQHYVTSVMQAPKYAQPGQPAIEKYLQLELKMIADVGLVGFPSAGKSTLLSVTTNARPKIAEYHFTTLSPNLGVVDLPDAPGFVMADIPGIIEGASEGVGLGFDFLRHIERTRVLVHVVDAAGVEGRDPVEDVRQINEELEKYNVELASRPMILACNKLDLLDAEEREITMQFLREAYEDKMVRILPISAATKEGVKELLYTISDLLKDLPKEKIVFEQEIDPDSFRETEQLSFTVEKSSEEEGVYLVEGPKIERMLGYTNLEDEKGFLFFQRFMKENGILQQLEDLGIQDGDTVRVYGHEFDYYHE
ncbi:MAG: GTPase ObgE [Eubacterium sp.]|nr:GTPase ObgE [Eubacterium sp.]